MGIGVGIFLIAVGAILTFAVNATTSGVNVDEATPGTPDTLSVVLERQPLNQNVTVTLTGSTDARIPGNQMLLQNAAVGSPDPANALTLTFTPANWNTAQTVNVFAVDDDYDEASPHVQHITAVMASF